MTFDRCKKREYLTPYTDKVRRSGDYAYAWALACAPKQKRHLEHGYKNARHFADMIAGRRRDEARNSAVLSRSETEQIRDEFTLLADQWRRDTRHLSIVQKKITHPSYLRIIGMGRPAVPLLLETLRDRPSHWFAALRAVSNVDPVPVDANPATAREAWLEWGRAHGLIE